MWSGRADNEVDDGTGHQYLSRLGQCCDSPRDADRQPADVVASHLYLPGVNAGPSLKSEVGRLISNGAGTHDRPRWSIEGGQRGVAGRVDLSASETNELP